jgi:hypothetical protein
VTRPNCPPLQSLGSSHASTPVHRCTGWDLSWGSVSATLLRPRVGASRPGSGLDRYRAVLPAGLGVLMMTSRTRARLVVPLQRFRRESPALRVASSQATLLGFFASIARVMIASQVPETFRPRHLQGLLLPSWQLVTRGPTRGCGSASEVLPSEVFPLAAWSPVSGVLPSCRWSLGGSSTSGS